MYVLRISSTWLTHNSLTQRVYSVTDMRQCIKTIFFYGTTYTYSNLSRLFIRLFVGVMLFRFGMRQMLSYSAISQSFPDVMGIDGHTALAVMIGIEIVCSLLIMVGLFSRFSCLPAMVPMVVAVNRMLSMANVSDIADLGAMHPVYLPIMFLGVFVFIILAGPGKVSLDYVISVHLISRDQNSQADDEILKKA